MKSIVIISSGQPGANPRAVKEALLLNENGYAVTFIYCPLSPWADEFDEKLFRENPGIKWIRAGFHPLKNKWRYAYSRIRRRFYEKVVGLFPKNISAKVKSYVLFSQELKREALKHKASLYIGHNLGAVDAVVAAAKKHHAKAGFDAEDFHRGEFPSGSNRQKLTAAIEDAYFPLLNYCTAASLMIAGAYQFIFPSKVFTVVNNVFDIKYLTPAVKENTEELSIFWFSQFTGAGRGLEDAVAAMAKCNNPNIRLYLLGNVRDEYSQELEAAAPADSITFLRTVPADQIFSLAAKFDIGLAAEVPETINRDLCLTNKVFTYCLAGNCLLMSNTKAQSFLLKENPDAGFLYNSGDADRLAEIIAMLYNDRVLLTKAKQASRQMAAEKYNLQEDAVTILKKVNDVLTQA